MTSVSVFPNLTRSLSDIYEDELFHINQNQIQQQQNPASPKLTNKVSEAELQMSIPELDMASDFFGVNNIATDNKFDHVQPFNEYSNPDLDLHDAHAPSHYMLQNINPFAGKVDVVDDFLSVNMYENDYDTTNYLMNPASKKYGMDSIPSLNVFPMELPDEDLEDYESDDDEEEDDDDMMTIQPEFFDSGHQFNESSPISSVGSSPFTKSNTKLYHGFENAVEEEEDTVKAMELDSSDSSDYEDGLDLPKFDNNGLFKTTRSDSIVNDSENIDVASPQYPFNHGGKKTSGTPLKQLSNSMVNIYNPGKTKHGKSSSISKVRSKKTYVLPVAEPVPVTDNSGLTGDFNNQCTLTNPMTSLPCLKKFSRPYDLIRHQETIHASKKKIFRCIICETNHKKTVNNNTSVSSEDPELAALHSPKTFSRGDALSRHIRVKHGLTGNAVAEAIKYAKDNVEYVDIKQ